MKFSSTWILNPPEKKREFLAQFWEKIALLESGLAESTTSFIYCISSVNRDKASRSLLDPLHDKVVLSLLFFFHLSSLGLISNYSRFFFSLSLLFSLCLSPKIISWNERGECSFGRSWVYLSYITKERKRRNEQGPKGRIDIKWQITRH